MLKLLVAALCLIPLAHAREFDSLTIALSSPSASQAVLDEMRAEFARIIKQADLQTYWMSGEEASQSDHSRLVVVRMLGNCSSDPAYSPALVHAQPVSLASTDVVDGKVLSFSKVHCEEVRRYLTPALLGSRASQRPRLFGRALGRIVAHEAYHMLAQTRHHHESGVSRSCFSIQDLTAENFNFDPVSLALLRPKPAPQTSSDNSFLPDVDFATR